LQSAKELQNSSVSESCDLRAQLEQPLLLAISWCVHTADMATRPTNGQCLLIDFNKKKGEASCMGLKTVLTERMADVNSVGAGAAMLHQVCSYSICNCCTRESLVQLLLDHGADPNLPSENGATALMLTNSVAVAKLLMNSGANVMARCERGFTALCVHAEAGRMALCKLLIKKGGRELVNSGDNLGDKPLTKAARSGHEDVALLLLEHQDAAFDVNAMVGENTLLWFAAEQNLYKLCEVLLKLYKADPNIPCQQGATPFTYAAQRGELAIAGLLHTHGADIAAADAHGRTALLLACTTGEEGVIKKLIKWGVDVNTVHTNGLPSALLNAAFCGNFEVVRLLLAAGARVTLEYWLANSNNILTCSFRQFNTGDALELLSMLLPHVGAAVDSEIAEEGGCTVLQIAAGQGCVQVCKELIKEGADPNRLHKGCNLWHYAACCCNSDDAKPGSGAASDVKALQWVQTLQLDPRAVCDAGRLPVSYACQSGSTACVKYLLKLPGAADDVQTAVSSDDRTLLHW
jgi:ankyrin repeat protein